jgi:hypothetical protein
MTADELHGELEAKAPFLSAEEWGAFLTARPQDQQTIAEGFRLAAIAAGPDYVRNAVDLLQSVGGLVPLPGINTGIALLRKLLGE